MNKLFYPAVFQIEEEGGFSICFPDIDGCLTQGEDMEDGYRMAVDAMGLVLSDMKENAQPLPKPSTPNMVQLEENQFIAVIEFDMMEYLRRNESKAVKKTLTIPSWLNELALEQNINFSQVLQDALITKIGT